MTYKSITWNQFQIGAKIAQDSQGMEEQEIHRILRFVAVTFKIEGKQLISESWKIYKNSGSGVKNKYLLNTNGGGQCTVVSETTKSAFEIADKNGWEPKNQLPIFIQSL